MFPKLIASVEPDSDQYRKTEEALGHYLQLAKQPAGEGLPPVDKPIAAGAPYAAAGVLRTRLQLEGDLEGAGAPGAPSGPTSSYSQDLSDGVKHYQARHGITPDGQAFRADDCKPERADECAGGAVERLLGALALAAE